MRPLLRSRWLGLVLALVLAVSTACGGSDDGKEASSSESPSSGEPSSSQVDVPDVPDVVAEVNGEEISKEDFAEAYETQAQAQQAATQQAQSGQQPDPKQLTDQTVQSLVNEELLRQEAEKRGIDPSEKEVEQTLADLAKENGLGSVDTFVKALEDQGMSRDEINSQAAQQTRFDMLVADEGGPVKATDQEVRALYQQLKAQQAGQSGQGPAVPPLKQVRPQLTTQVEQQKESQTARTLIDRLRKDADITINV